MKIGIKTENRLRPLGKDPEETRTAARHGSIEGAFAV